MLHEKNSPFEHFTSLKEFLESLKGYKNSSLCTAPPPQLSKVLTTTFVGWNSYEIDKATLTIKEETYLTQSEVVDLVVARLFKSKSSSSVSENVLRLGYSALSIKNKNHTGAMPGLENTFPNSLITELKSDDWSLLLGL